MMVLMFSYLEVRLFDDTAFNAYQLVTKSSLRSYSRYPSPISHSCPLRGLNGPTNFDEMTS